MRHIDMSQHDVILHAHDNSFMPAWGILLFLLFAAAIIIVGWVLPITLGIRTANRKGYSPLWMLFGIHPMFGWVAFIVLTCLPPRIQCPSCGGFIDSNFRICPFCRRDLPVYYLASDGRLYPSSAYPPPYPPGGPTGYPSPGGYQAPGPSGPSDPGPPGGRA